MFNCRLKVFWIEFNMTKEFSVYSLVVSFSLQQSTPSCLFTNNTFRTWWFYLIVHLEWFLLYHIQLSLKPMWNYFHKVIVLRRYVLLQQIEVFFSGNFNPFSALTDHLCTNNNNNNNNNYNNAVYSLSKLCCWWALWHRITGF